MSQIHLDHADVIELGQMLTFVAEWLSGNQKPILTEKIDATRHPVDRITRITAVMCWQGVPSDRFDL
jgi:hypothetical protein